MFFIDQTLNNYLFKKVGWNICFKILGQIFQTTVYEKSSAKC